MTKPRTRARRASPKQPPERDYAPRIVFRLHNEVRIPHQGDLADHLTRLGLGDAVGLKASLPGLAFRRVVQAPDSTGLDRLLELAQQRDPTYRPARLDNYISVRVPPGAEPKAVLEALSRFHLASRPFIDDSAVPIPPPGWSEQVYLQSATTGIGLYGSAGESSVLDSPNENNLGTGVKIVDIEGDWGAHSYLGGVPASTAFGVKSGVAADQTHGRRVLGFISSTGAAAYRGIAPAAAIHLATPLDSNGNYSVTNAVYQALADTSIALDFGDILLLEVQTRKHDDPSTYVPVEARPDVCEAIRLATALGIIVIEPAGTQTTEAAVNLDDYTDMDGKLIFRRPSEMNPDFRDSGAILVSASQDSSMHERANLCNYGNRVDFFALAEAGTDVLSDDGTSVDTTTAPAATSWAAAILAGVAAVAQQKEKAAGIPLGPGPMRTLLTEQSATPPDGSATNQLGVMPNLQEIAASTGLVADVYMKDNQADNGQPNTTGTLSASPDIVARSTAPADETPPNDPEVSFPDTNPPTKYSQTIEYGQDNYLYCRVRNRGGAVAHNVKARVYWAPGSSLPTPDQWTLIGEKAVPGLTLDHGQSKITGPITWPAHKVPGVAHYCFIGICGSDEDPMPAPSAMLNGAEYQKLVSRNNNIVWQNFNVVDTNPANFVEDGPAPAPGSDEPDVDAPEEGDEVPPDAVSAAVDVGGMPAEQVDMDVQICANLPPGSRLELEAPLSLIRRLLKAQPPFVKPLGRSTRLARMTVKPPGLVRVPVKPKELARMPLKAQGCTLYRGVTLPAGYRETVRFIADIPKQLRAKGRYEVSIRQLADGVELGRYTFIFQWLPTKRKGKQTLTSKKARKSTKTSKSKQAPKKTSKSKQTPKRKQAPKVSKPRKAPVRAGGRVQSKKAAGKRVVRRRKR